MQKKLLFLIFMLTVSVSYGQLTCPILTLPQGGETDVPVETIITWNAVEGVPGYLISLGTTPGGTDLVERRSVGVSTSFRPALGLPEDTEIFVTVTLFFFDQENTECPIGSFRTEDVTVPPACTTPRFPVNGSTTVDVGTSIAWNYAPKATGYLLTMGTSPGATDILDNQTIVSSPFYLPPQDLPVDQEIFVRVVPFNENGPAPEICTEYSFTTRASAVLPGCATLISPANGAINVPLTPLLEWTAVPEATGYTVSIGSSPFENDVLDNLVFTTNSTLVIEFEPNRTFFVTVVPFNDAGDAIGCNQTTFSTILGCGPFLNSEGALVSINPDISFPEVISFCQNEIPYTVTAKDTADGYRWFKINPDETEELLSSTAELALSDEGLYRYEAYNTASQSGNTIECISAQEFTVVSSGIASDVVLDVTAQNGNLRISVQAEGSGDYEYALDDIEGPYQDGTVFEDVPIGAHDIYVRDKNGCGIAEERFEPDLTLEGFPKFFTPNGDGINDFWQFIPPPESGDIPINTIHIFDRFGNLLAQIDPQEEGWDGNFKGRPLPSSDYWFKAILTENRIIKGHFSLKR